MVAKHTLPILGVTKARQVEDAVKASKIVLSQDEITVWKNQQNMLIFKQLENGKNQ